MFISSSFSCSINQVFPSLSKVSDYINRYLPVPFNSLVSKCFKSDYFSLLLFYLIVCRISSSLTSSLPILCPFDRGLSTLRGALSVRDNRVEKSKKQCRIHGQYQSRTGGQGRKCAFSHFLNSITSTDQPSDRPTDGRTKPLIESLVRD